MSDPTRPSEPTSGRPAPTDVTVPWFSTAGMIQAHAEKPRPAAPPPPRRPPLPRPRDLLLAFCGLPLAFCMLGEVPRVHPPPPPPCHCPPTPTEPAPPASLSSQPPAPSQPPATPGPIVEPIDPVAEPAAPRKRRARARARARDDFATTARSIERQLIGPACARFVAPGEAAQVKLSHSTRAGVVVGARRRGHADDGVGRCVLDKVLQAVKAGTWKARTARRFTYTVRGPARSSS